MALVYFDTSALVKLVIEEEGSDLAADLWDGATGRSCSRLGFAEVRAALGAARRNARLSAAELSTAEALVEELWAQVRAVELSSSVQTDAGQLAVDHGLSGADAVHLASLLAVGPHTAILAVWDRRLHAAGVALGLTVAPGSLT